MPMRNDGNEIPDFGLYKPTWRHAEMLIAGPVRAGPGAVQATVQVAIRAASATTRRRSHRPNTDRPRHQIASTMP